MNIRTVEIQSPMALSELRLPEWPGAIPLMDASPIDSVFFTPPSGDLFDDGDDNVIGGGASAGRKSRAGLERN